MPTTRARGLRGHALSIVTLNFTAWPSEISVYYECALIMLDALSVGWRVLQCKT